MSDNKEFKDLDSLFDSIFNENVSADEMRNRVYDNNFKYGSNNNTVNNRGPLVQIVRPTLNKEAKNKKFNTRYAYFENYISNIDYPNNMKEDYFSGFKDAIEKYYRRSQAYKKNLMLLENVVADELNKYSYRKRRSLNYYNRGYNDGLQYIEGSLKRSKKMMEDEITAVLVRTIL